MHKWGRDGRVASYIIREFERTTACDMPCALLDGAGLGVVGAAHHVVDVLGQQRHRLLGVTLMIQYEPRGDRDQPAGIDEPMCIHPQPPQQNQNPPSRPRQSATPPTPTAPPARPRSPPPPPPGQGQGQSPRPPPSCCRRPRPRPWRSRRCSRWTTRAPAAWAGAGAAWPRATRGARQRRRGRRGLLPAAAAHAAAVLPRWCGASTRRRPRRRSSPLAAPPRGGRWRAGRWWGGWGGWGCRRGERRGGRSRCTVFVVV